VKSFECDNIPAYFTSYLESSPGDRRGVRVFDLWAEILSRGLLALLRKIAEVVQMKFHSISEADDKFDA